jgi:iron complex transport system substrate-binding protein
MICLRSVPLLLLIVISCGGRQTDAPAPFSSADTSLVVFGPSLTELIFASGEGWRVSGVDRYSTWPVEASDLTSVGGYLDASFEQIVGLSPTSIHSVGHNAELLMIADRLDIPYYSYSFDTLEDVFSAADSLEARYGTRIRFRDELSGKLESLRSTLERNEPSLLLIIYHLPGSGTMTVVGRNTFLADIVSAIGCHLAAPRAGTYPSVSIEGVLELSPEYIICLYPDAPDTQLTRSIEIEFWEKFGFSGERVHVLFDDYLLIPGSRLGLTAERLMECIRS